MKEFAPKDSKFFPVRVDQTPFHKGGKNGIHSQHTYEMLSPVFKEIEEKILICLSVFQFIGLNIKLCFLGYTDE